VPQPVRIHDAQPGALGDDGDCLGQGADSQAAVRRPRLDEHRASGGGARAHLARAKVRHAGGDFAGQIEDFREALEREPGLFPPQERRRIERLLRGAKGEKTA